MPTSLLRALAPIGACLIAALAGALAHPAMALAGIAGARRGRRGRELGALPAQRLPLLSTMPAMREWASRASTATARRRRAARRPTACFPRRSAATPVTARSTSTRTASRQASGPRAGLRLLSRRASSGRRQSRRAPLAPSREPALRSRGARARGNPVRDVPRGRPSTGLTTTRALPRMGVCASCHGVGGTTFATATSVISPPREAASARASRPAAPAVVDARGGARAGPGVRHKMVAGADSTLCATVPHGAGVHRLSRRPGSAAQDSPERLARPPRGGRAAERFRAARAATASSRSVSRVTSAPGSRSRDRTGATATAAGSTPEVRLVGLTKDAGAPLVGSRAKHPGLRELPHRARLRPLPRHGRERRSRWAFSHPPGFETTCGAALAKNARPCFFCHDGSDGSLSRCR